MSMILTTMKTMKNTTVYNNEDVNKTTTSANPTKKHHVHT